MLNYLNGIGANRRANKGVHKMHTIKAAKVIQKVAKKSPLTAIRMKKAVIEQRVRDAHARNRSFMLAKEPELIPDINKEADEYLQQGIYEVDKPEFESNSIEDTNTNELGIIYPDDLATINGKRGRARRDEKRALKKEKKMSKVELRKSKAEAKKLKAEGKRLRGEGKRLKGEGGGSGDVKDYITQGLDTVKSVFGKGGGQSEAPDTESGSGSGSGSGSFFSEYKMPIMLGGAALAAMFIIPKFTKNK